jgi:hypothetical protein
MLSKPASESLYGHFAVKWSPLQILQTTFPAPAFERVAFKACCSDGSNSADCCARVKELVKVMLIAPNLVSGSKLQKDHLTDGRGRPIWARFFALFKPELGPCFSFRYGMLH